MRSWMFGLCLLACAAKPEPKPAPSTVYLPPAEKVEPTTTPSEPPERSSSTATNYRNRPPASAEDRVRAEELFREGRQLIAKGDYPAACNKLEESLNVDPALGTLMNLADCRRKEGNVAAACSLFTQAQEWAKETGSAEREHFITETLKSLGC